MADDERTDSDSEELARSIPFGAPCSGAACEPEIRWRHPDGEQLYRAIMASPRTTDVFTTGMTPAASRRIAFFDNVRSQLAIPPGQTLGILLKMHSLLTVNVLPTPFGITVNKNNSSPCGTGTNMSIHNSAISPAYPSVVVASELERGFTDCYTLQHYVEEILADPQYRFDRSSNQLIFVGDPTKMPHAVDLREFNGACSTTMNITHMLTKSYDTRRRDPFFVPEFYLSFNGITLNLLHSGLQVFLETFRVNLTDPLQIHVLTDVFAQIQGGPLLTKHIFTLIEFFRDIFGAAAVNIFDSGCTTIYDATQGRLLSPSEGHESISQLKYRGVFFDGYGGKKTKRKRKTKRKTKTKRKNKKI
jgi:hypothetical protein